MSFAQLTGRECLRDIENCLTAFSNRLYPSGIKHPVPKSTLADAYEKRDWRIYADFAQVLIKKVRLLCFDDKDFRPDIEYGLYFCQYHDRPVFKSLSMGQVSSSYQGVLRN